MSVFTGTSITYGVSGTFRRANGGVHMFDTLGAVNDLTVTLVNVDLTAQLVVKTATVLDGSASNFVIVGPGQAAQFFSEDGEWRTISQPDRTKLRQPTRIYVDCVAGSDINSGLERSMAFKHVQQAVDFVYNRVHLNNNPVEFFLCRNLDGLGNPIPYTPGFIEMTLLTGQPSDLGVIVRGERDPGGPVNVRITDSGNGCLHVAGGGQMYAYDLQVQSNSPSPPCFAGYGALLGLKDIVIFGYNNGALVSADYDGKIQIFGGHHIYGTASAGWASSYGGMVYAGGDATCYLYGPSISFAFALAANQGRISMQNQWVGSGSGKRFLGLNGGCLSSVGDTTRIPFSLPGGLDSSSSYNGVMGPL